MAKGCIDQIVLVGLFVTKTIIVFVHGQYCVQQMFKTVTGIAQSQQKECNESNITHLDLFTVENDT